MKNLSVFLILILLSTGFINAQTDSLSIKNNKIGLVLSGGGSRGYAHIGVLRVLEELNIKPDYITGTSQGALIGAMYSLGYSVDEIEDVIKEIDWDSVFSDQITYKEISFFDKKYHQRQPVKLVFNKGITPQLPKGVIEGQNLQNLFSKLAWRSNFYENFDKFPIPFRCVATDLVSGNPFVFKQGDLATAMRSSMSVPVLFSPIDIDTMLLVDGGVLRNFPVKECKEMGADIIIGVYAVGNNDAPKKEEINSLKKLIKRGTKVFLNDLEEQDIQLTDVLIIPELNEFIGVEMKKYQTIANRGELAARKSTVYHQLMEIAKLRETKKNEKSIIDYSYITIDQIKIIGSNHTKVNEILQQSGLTISSKINAKTMLDAISKIYKLGRFKRVTYQLLMLNSKQILEIHVTEKDRLDLRVGMHFSNFYGLEGMIDVIYDDFLFSNSKLNFKTAIGDKPRALLSYTYMPFRKKNIELSFNTYLQRTTMPSITDVYSLNDINGEVKEMLLDANFGLAWSPFMNTSLHANYGIILSGVSADLENELDSNQTFKIKTNYNFYNLGFSLNTFNDAYFPTKGLKLDINYKNQFNGEVLGDIRSIFENDFIENTKMYTLNYSQFIPVSNDVSIISQLEIGALSDKPFFTHNYFIGGVNNQQRPNRINYGAFNTNTIATNNYTIASLGLQYQYKDVLFFQIKGQGLSIEKHQNLIFSLETIQEKAINNLQFSILYKSLIGPISFSLAKSKGYGLASFIAIGVDF